MINTDYSCHYFIDFHERFSAFLFSKTSRINNLDIQIVFKNLDYIFPKEQVNSLYVSSGINNNSDDDFFNHIFDEIIKKIIYKIHYFKSVYFPHFIHGSEFFNHFIEEKEKNLQRIVIRHIRFVHQNKNCFYFHYDYKIILIEIFKRVYSSLEHKLERSQIINEIKRLQQLSIQSAEFSFLNELIVFLRNIDSVIKLDLDKVQQILEPLLNKWFMEDRSKDIFKFILNDSLEIRNSFELRKPVQYFYYLLFVLKDFNLISDNRINELISKGIFTHWDKNKIDLETLSNARHRYKQFDFLKKDNNKSAGCIIDLYNLKKSLSEIAK